MSEASLNAKLHKGAQLRLKAEIDSLKKWREDHYPKVRTFMQCVTLVEGPPVRSGPPTGHVCFLIFSELNENLPQKMFGGLKDVERYEKQFKEATLPYTNAIDHVNTSKAKYHQDKG